MTPSRLSTVILACLLAAACAAPGVESESQPEPAVERGNQTRAERPVAQPGQPPPQLVADLAPRRIKGRQQLDLGSGRTLHADRLEPQADGTLELRGWPAMEFRVGRIVATDAATVFFLSESRMRTEGPSGALMH